MAKQSNEPTVRTTLRIPESLMNRFMASFSHRDARSINAAMCQLIAAHVKFYEQTHQNADSKPWTANGLDMPTHRWGRLETQETGDE